ncbi:hypothetical protein [Candidatus Williamhamiltonella defendens]|uniref:hypothetical protein n=1 Tax=Candidatus Williamhamiltonella defendens TaxID=138072 RepID=UPI0009E2F9EF|nr:hypothetical protein [Candidatus Hamiltonella defensa]
MKIKASIEKREPDKDGKQSLRLVYYFGTSIDPETGKRIRYKRREPLELYLFQKTKTPQQRQHNKETMRLAEAIKAKRLLESQSGKHGLDHYPQTFTCISWNS